MKIVDSGTKNCVGKGDLKKIDDDSFELYMYPTVDGKSYHHLVTKLTFKNQSYETFNKLETIELNDVEKTFTKHVLDYEKILDDNVKGCEGISEEEAKRILHEYLQISSIIMYLNILGKDSQFKVKKLKNKEAMLRMKLKEVKVL